MQPTDRLAAAWTVACGPALAGRGTVVGYEQRVLHVAVQDSMWLAEMRSMRGVLARRVEQAAGVPVSDIQFEPAGIPNIQRSASR